MHVEVADDYVLRALNILIDLLTILDDNGVVVTRDVDSLNEEVVDGCVDSISVKSEHWDLSAKDVLPWVDDDLKVMKVHIA